MRQMRTPDGQVWDLTTSELEKHLLAVRPGVIYLDDAPETEAEPSTTPEPSLDPEPAPVAPAAESPLAVRERLRREAAVREAAQHTS